MNSELVDIYKKINKIAFEKIRNNCEACLINSLSQKHHTCFYDNFGNYYSEAIKELVEKNIITKENLEHFKEWHNE